MSKAALQTILQDFLADDSRQKKLPLSYLKVIDKLVTCRTAALGGHAQYCENHHLCGVWYNSCKHRFCPQCRGMATEEWLQNTKNILLDCPHHHIIFTLPEELNVLWRYNKTVMTDSLFKAAQHTLLQFAKDPKYLNAMPAMLCALHTWGRSLSLHPHIHALISHGGINNYGEWVAPKKDCLFPQKPLMMVFRGKLLADIRQAMQHSQWIFPPNHNETHINNLLNKLGRNPWVVHCCERYEYANGVVKYLSRYVKSGPVKLSQVRRTGEKKVSFHYFSHQSQRHQVLTLDTNTFVRRLIQHTPIKGKPTIRYCGLYNSAARGKLNIAREALGQAPVSARVLLKWQSFLAEKGHEVCCEICGSSVSKLMDIPPIRPAE